MGNKIMKTLLTRNKLSNFNPIQNMIWNYFMDCGGIMVRSGFAILKLSQANLKLYNDLHLALLPSAAHNKSKLILYELWFWFYLLPKQVGKTWKFSSKNRAKYKFFKHISEHVKYEFKKKKYDLL